MFRQNNPGSFLEIFHHQPPSCKFFYRATVRPGTISTGAIKSILQNLLLGQRDRRDWSMEKWWTMSNLKMLDSQSGSDIWAMFSGEVFDMPIDIKVKPKNSLRVNPPEPCLHSWLALVRVWRKQVSNVSEQCQKALRNDSNKGLGFGGCSVGGWWQSPTNQG
jgi:hypothetical protein